MAASVSRQFPGLNGGAVHTFKSGPHHRSDSPLRGYNFPPSSEFSVPKIANGLHEDDSSSDEEDENEFRDLIWKVNREMEPSVLDARDEGTADNWIVRNSTMVRLTGKHPFNAEAPLTRLMKQGFITPVPLHYVRNHGAVPKADWATWTVEVSGLVKRPAKFTMDQLVNDFPSREFPVTLVCAGNRRKEQNMVKKTIGFNWGAAGVSTSVWRGVPLRYVLKRCGIFGKNDGGLNVCFEGAEDLPGGGGSKYGTSIKKKIAMDPARDVIIAYMQNGEKLLPDHGFPVRMIIPGFIGGRMVKWLKRIIVTTKESENHYHFKDNRVLPSHVDPELANAEAWWYKPEYIINDLNINSVITSPGHEEILPINSWTTQRPYTLRGYAYSGGGKRVTRVEVTMNGGENWYVCQLDQPEKGNKYGKFWCWCFWSLEVEVLEILACKEIAVRAWDESLNTQPEKLNWNLMGMMNNCWFRVKTNVCRPHKGEIGMVFEHPTVPGNQSGGWMAKEKHLEASTETAPALQKSVSSPAINTNVKTFSMSEVSKHNDENSVWIVVHNHVYDCTPFLKDHPGGTDSILINAGIDCTEEFDAIHSDKAKKMLEDYRIGELSSTDAPSDSAASLPNTSVNGASNTYSMSEVSKHNDTNSAWIVVNNHVYDCTPFLKDHPGGTDSIIINAGTDCTEEFEAIHSDKAKKMLEDYRIGELGSTDSTSVSTASPPNTLVNGASKTHVPLAPIKELAPPVKEIAPPKRIALVPQEKIPCKLIAKTSISHDVRIFRFGLPSDDMLLGLPVGKHIFVCGNIEGKLCMRAYTPSSTIDEVGFFELLVKVYFKNVHPKFPNGGLMSQYLDSLQLGDGIEIKGPLGHIEYTGRGNFLVHKKPKFAKKLAMIAGGTGITPIYQVVQAILKDPEDETEMFIVYANRTEDDILLREELDAWAEQHKRLKVWYVVQESIKEGWKYSIGFITETILREHIPDGSDSALALVCGPPPMIQFAVQPNLEKMNYDVKESMLVF